MPCRIASELRALRMTIVENSPACANFLLTKNPHSAALHPGYCSSACAAHPLLKPSCPSRPSSQVCQPKETLDSAALHPGYELCVPCVVCGKFSSREARTTSTNTLSSFLFHRAGRGSGPESFLKSSTTSRSRGSSRIALSCSSGISGDASKPDSFLNSR